LKKKLLVTLSAIMVLILIGCSPHTHVVGNGAKGGESVSARQWYILCGLVPLNNVDTKQMSAGATDYTIKTRESFIDILLSCVTSFVTIGSRTVTVEK